MTTTATDPTDPSGHIPRPRDLSPVTVDEARAKLHAALAAAQGEFPTIGRAKTVTVRMKEGGTYSFAYATLDQILNAVRPVLSRHGLAIVQPLENPSGGSPSIRTMLLHANGGVLASSFPIPVVSTNPQELGSLLTYLRRYALVSLLGLAAEEDDDGNVASGHTAVASGSGATGDTTVPQAGPDAIPPTTGMTDSPFQPPEFRPGSDDAADTISDPQRKKIYALRTKLLNAGVFTELTWKHVLSSDYGTESVAELTKSQASSLISRLVATEDEHGL